MMAGSNHSRNDGVAIIAGGGNMPLSVAQAAQSLGKNVHLFGIKGSASEEIERFPHSWINFGHIGKILSVSRSQGCGQMVIVGSVRRPRISDLRFDLGGLMNIFPLLFGWTTGGDNTVLSGIISFFESKGFTVIGAHEIAPDLLAGQEVLTRKKPGKVDRQDIKVGLNVVSALGALDVGQAAVVAHEYVLAVEAAEGTDKMLERCKALNKWGHAGRRKRAGVLVKCAKPGQERRIDLPTVGPDTVALADDAGLAGIAIAANDVLVADRDELVRRADEAGLFVVGIDANSFKAE